MLVREISILVPKRSLCVVIWTIETIEIRGIGARGDQI